MVDTYVDNDISKCIGCRACSAICPEGSVYITEFVYNNKTTFHVHFRKEKQNCGRCIKKNKHAPCVEICPEQSMEIISF